MFIKILPEEIRRKISAGEVIEGPSDVVKELIENSIDAKSTQIEVEIVKGGKSLVRVKDNGVGIHRDDIEKVYLEGATSKIEREEDLLNIATYGFRGEALHAITSVSRTYIRSRYFQDKVGKEIFVEGGTLLKVRDRGMSYGTEVEVRDLFFNIPVRQKFLKKQETERGKVFKVFKEYALVNPEIEFRLISEGKEILHLKPAGAKERVEEIFNMSFEHIEGRKGMMAVNAFISRNVERGEIFVFVNGRPVYNKNLKEFFRKLIGYKACGVFFIDLPLYAVDVNIHPKKREIKIRKEREVLSSIREIVSPSSVEFEAEFLSQNIPEYGERLFEVVGVLKDRIIVAVIDEFLYFFDQHLLSERMKYEVEGITEEEACRGAIKGGEKLRREIIEELIRAWFSFENPHVCPHGRPIYYRIPLSDIYSKLDRKV